MALEMVRIIYMQGFGDWFKWTLHGKAGDLYIDDIHE